MTNLIDDNTILTLDDYFESAIAVAFHAISKYGYLCTLIYYHSPFLLLLIQ